MDTRHRKRSRSRPKQNYTCAAKRLCLSRVGLEKEVRRGNKESVKTFVKKGKGPSRATLYRWMKEEKDTALKGKANSKRGRPSLLSEDQKLVVGGWILKRDKEYKRSSSKEIIPFIKKHFGLSVNKMLVSRIMKELKLSSHQSGRRVLKYTRKDLPGKLFKFVRGLNQDIKAREDLSRVIAIDNVRFTHPPLQIRTYGPQGG
jgi:transposase